MSLVTPKEFAAANTTETGGVFDQPAFATKGQATHGITASNPIDGRDEVGGKAVFAVPVLNGAIGESVLLEFGLVDT